MVVGNNIYASNALSTTNIFATGNVVIGQGVTALQANVHIEQSNVFIGNSAAVGTIYNTLPSSIIKFDNSVISTISGSATASAANRILFHSNTTSAQNFSGIGVLVGAPSNFSQLNLFGGTISLYAGGTQYLFITAGNGTGFGTNNPRAGIHITTIPASSNTGLRVDSSNIALATTGGGLVGIGTTAPTANLHVIGNVYASNSLSTTNLVASGTISYSYDLVQQGAYLNPTTANSATIIQWYQRLVTTTGQPFWSVSTIPLFSQIPTSNLTGYASCSLLNDGRVLFTSWPFSNHLGIFTPERNQFSYISGISSINAYDYSTSVQIPDGRVIFIPCNGNKVGALNPLNYSLTTYSTGTTLGNLHYGAVYEPSGNVIMTPTTSSNIGIFNTNTNTYSRIPFATDAATQSTTIYSGSVLLPNGQVVFVPLNTSNIGIYTPTTAIYTNVTVVVNGSYSGGVLLQNGNVFMVPFTASSNAIIYSPSLNTISNITGLNGTIFGSSGGSGAVALPDGRVVLFSRRDNNASGIIIYNSINGTFNTVTGTNGVIFQNNAAMGGGTLVPDGRVFFPTNLGIGVLDTRTPAPREFCLHPFFNKF